jgi:hypothetical protein
MGGGNQIFPDGMFPDLSLEDPGVALAALFHRPSRLRGGGRWIVRGKETS